MAGRVLLLVFSFILSIIGCYGKGEMLIMHNPYALQFSAASKTRQSFLKEVYSASLGLSVLQNTDWDGLAIIDPFSTPEAAVEVYVEGFSKLDLPVKTKLPKLTISVDVYEPDTYDVMKHRIDQRFKDGANIVEYVDLSQLGQNEGKTIFGDIKCNKVSKQALLYLKPSVEEDYQFLAEVESLRDIAAKIENGAITADNAIDFYYFRITSLHALSDFHGINSLQTKEAKKILADAIQELNQAFVKAYEGSLLLTVVSTDVAHTRRVIRDIGSMDRSTDYLQEGGGGADSEYAAIFNIMLWFTVVFVFSMIAIVYTIMDMDPGRDSIIYRMTSTRMKKD